MWPEQFGLDKVFRLWPGSRLLSALQALSADCAITGWHAVLIVWQFAHHVFNI